jgi:hypothetical protein
MSRRVAFHEAGHAAMAMILGDKLHRVTIKPKGQHEGRTYVTSRSPSGHILTAVAGAAAEQIRFRRGYQMGGPDMREAMALVSRRGVGVFCLSAASLLRAHWPGVVAVALALEERETLKGAEAWDVFVRGLSPPRKPRKKRRR